MRLSRSARQSTTALRHENAHGCQNACIHIEMKTHLYISSAFNSNGGDHSALQRCDANICVSRRKRSKRNWFFTLLLSLPLSFVLSSKLVQATDRHSFILIKMDNKYQATARFARRCVTFLSYTRHTDSDVRARLDSNLIETKFGSLIIADL